MGMQMKFDLKKLFNLDRRIIYLLIFLSILIPFLVEFDLPIKANKDVKNIFNKIEDVAKNKGHQGSILLSFDFDNASKAELEPMARSLLAHAFKNNLRVIAMGHWPNGVELAKSILNDLAREFKKEYGEDWVYLGYRPGVSILIINMGKDFKSAFQTDAFGKNTKELAATKNIKTINDIDYVISLSAGSGGIEDWVVYGRSKYHFELGGACTAVMAADFYPFLQSGQLNGLIGGLAGAAQYETLLGRPAEAVSGMRPQSIAHIVLIFFILFGNFCYLIDRFYLSKRS
ncbi:MAG: hypothetical protein HQK50_09165 [Oligoflexia bacterium]|nr:hypothetical protein [Oligoflexia bacterium]MBF0365729.1 hypothetical protein [Oligoflexia bacterium]